ncbi:MAG TPA: DNA (cytosine-5-)-methyltransferase [Aequorivita sp.]|nr:DNA (cytosine-5-)-methyltransferase [Aequorivita sp.]
MQIKKQSRYSRIKEELDADLFNNNWLTIDTSKLIKKTKNIPFVDVFSGAGGISLGFTESGYKKISSVELDPDASETIRKNFIDSIHFEKKIEDISNEEILETHKNKKIKVLCGGPPCNGFSVAGYRNPKDPRNLYFREFIRFLKLLKPDFFMMENVPGILTMSEGKVKQIILQKFADAGYPNASVRILEAANFGVPQLRTRAIFIGNRHGLKNPYPKILVEKENYYPIESAIEDLAVHPRDASINHEWTRHSEDFEKRIAKVAPGKSLYDNYQDAYKRQYLNVPSMAIKENHGGTHIHPTLNRVISAREMARLQTFPDTFIFSGTMKRAMWQVGNAVPVKLAKEIANALKAYMSENDII